jgi:fucokinase
MDTDRGPRAPFDWIILTAANARQAAACEAQLAARTGHGPMRGVQGAFAVADARDARIGSGAATVLALAALARRLAAAHRGRPLEALLGGLRVLLLHSGGDSRRLPMYAAEGKLFATLPMQGRGNRCATVFDLLLEDLASLEPRAGGEVLVGAGDAVLGIARARLRFEGSGVVGVAQRADLARASRHGVFVAGPRGGTVAAFLQKPDAARMRAAGAVGRDGRALVDLGLFSFDPASAVALLRGSGVRVRGGGVSFARGSLADRASRAELPPVDLYREVAMALPGRTTRGAYLAACGGGSLARPLGALFDAMRGTPFRCEVARIAGFLHVGSTREMLDALVDAPGGAPARARGFGVPCGSFPLATPAVDDTPAPRGRGGAESAAPHGGLGARARLLELDAVVSGPVRLGQGRAIIDRCELGAVRLGGENVVVGVAERRMLDLPAGISLFRVPFGDGRAALVACGVDDDFKTRLDRGGTILGVPLVEFCRRAGLEPTDVLRGDGTLWDAPLWRAGRARVADIAWMWRGRRAPRAWREDRRRASMRDILARASAAEIAASREAIARRAALREPGRALDGALDGADARAIAEAMATAERAARLEATERLARALPAIADPGGRGHLAALGTLVAPAPALRASLRERAFAAVGEGVLGSLELPSRPERAAILHDQAVWTSTPVRVDLAGGWSDTPPICDEVGGAVVNVAVALRGQLPIQVVAKLDEVPRGEDPVIRVTSTDLGETRVLRTMRDLARRGDPTRWSSLAENALILAGVAPSDPKASLARWLRAVGGGVSLTMFSAVPKGSGLGTSSILGAATIRCLDRVFGRDRGQAGLLAATSALEQMLSTRGGWQDQAGGVVGGFKLARTRAGGPQVPSVQSIDVPRSIREAYGSRAFLYFTGERRMAKNILENVVWSWLAREPRARDAVDLLRANAARMRAALEAGDAEASFAEIDAYREAKTLIDPGSCPAWMSALARSWRRDLAAWSFAGAGGGGFMLVVARSAEAARRLQARIARRPAHPRARCFPFEVDAAGIRCDVL